ncbi:hypothetical protein D9758_017826 [Tetrapyrgos nigripes]|uniref:Uncharacterized protein n=1 Tax=Tetrapyrgos nigripes TaxID=182062 RepID=A0A8H5FG11_9AGAR|nr:hypothetical protein D9758_017826 [Tetrapyrgos nigripes]
MGQGQTFPQTMKQEECNIPIFQRLASLKTLHWLAGWASAGLAAWAPNLYSHYADIMSQLRRHQGPSFRFNWDNSIFVCSETITYVHQDYLNYCYGWCAITALGSFDHRRGGQLVLWDLKLVIDFPAGSTILIPSAYLRHSNTVISPREKRYSFTQYTAGAIFRYVEDGMRTHASMSAKERKEKERDAHQCVPECMEQLYSMYVPLEKP